MTYENQTKAYFFILINEISIRFSDFVIC